MGALVILLLFAGAGAAGATIGLMAGDASFVVFSVPWLVLGLWGVAEWLGGVPPAFVHTGSFYLIAIVALAVAQAAISRNLAFVTTQLPTHLVGLAIYLWVRARTDEKRGRVARNWWE